MTLRYGFKSDANRLSVELRGEMGLRATDPLDPRGLAAHLEIPVAEFSSFLVSAPDVAPLLDERSSEVSAATIHLGYRRLVLVNDSHVPERQNSSVAHELAHALLQHPPGPAIDEFGCRHWDGEVEEEAAWLGGVLLITNEGARALVARRLADHAAREQYGVSQEMLTWRKRMSGGMRMNRAA